MKFWEALKLMVEDGKTVRNKSNSPDQLLCWDKGTKTLQWNKSGVIFASSGPKVLFDAMDGIWEVVPKTKEFHELKTGATFYIANTRWMKIVGISEGNTFNSINQFGETRWIMASDVVEVQC